VRKPGSKEKIRQYLLANIGRVLSSAELQEASGGVAEWARRTRELRDQAGEGIKAGWGIVCKASLRSGLRIFAGLCLWRLPKPEESRVECKRLEAGQVAFGELVEREPATAAE
jgi:hypothetical protein